MKTETYLAILLGATLGLAITGGILLSVAVDIRESVDKMQRDVAEMRFN